MKTVVVWMMLAWAGFDKGSPVIVDDIATLEDCRRVQAFVKSWHDAPIYVAPPIQSKCIQYRKVAAK